MEQVLGKGFQNHEGATGKGRHALVSKPFKKSVLRTDASNLQLGSVIL